MCSRMGSGFHLRVLNYMAPEERQGDHLVRPGGGLKREAADAADASGETMIGGDDV